MADQLRKQWRNPKDIMSVLMILGSDAVHKTIAQMAGGPFVPTPFSFGWVGYAFAALGNAVGSGKLLPEPDWPTCVINLKNGYVRQNCSWILGRLLRDFETREKHKDYALKIVVYNVDLNDVRPRPARWWWWWTKKDREVYIKPKRDWVWWSGIVTIVIQLGVAITPWLTDGDWAIFMTSTAGNLLAVAGASWPNMSAEKWAGRRSNKCVALTRGNGSRYIMILKYRDGEKGLDLEDLATAMTTPSLWDRIVTGTLAMAWVLLLFNICGLQDNTWYILGIGVTGMLQNQLVSGVQRDPASLGIPLTKVEEIRELKVMNALKKAETHYPGFGESLLPTFFPGELWPDEVSWWEKQKMESKVIKEAKRQAKLARKVDF
ncbi:hypothetical protein L873DRAFT_1802759 [Choiromyces venosus 120613-1]|uniref:Uncharacterized protein n=1 Tax=Choiromyces venosus 120613-1 TaxID=1336337 RepID=A0A3N4JUB7_9PEZI|nr:hypothetical protein L873DRAFT_1802759 [Choiromyces venosus 120613-1]